jgi:serine/threonine-protein kinase
VEIVGDIGAGHTLGRYELLIPIASGGMASVWAARRTGARDGQFVAVKVMLSELVDDAHFEKMFLDEAEIASRVKHPNVVDILELGEQDGVLYQVMEWVDGEPLHQLLREVRDKGGVPIPLVVRIAVQVCAGLHAAHELIDDSGQSMGLVHRDVSPQNLLIGYDGTVKVVDFGIAKAASNRQQTTVGQMKGKAPYMAPEQALGDKVDRRTDVFALGIVLFQLTTGRHPFRGENDLLTLRRIVGRDPSPRAISVMPTLPPEIDQIIATAMSKDRDARFATMHDMRLALEAALPRSSAASTRDLGEFLRRHLSRRGDRRRAAIREAARVADQRAGTRGAPEVPSRRPQPRSSQAAPPPAASTRPEPPRSVARARRRDGSSVAALVVVALLALGSIGLYLWEESRAVPPGPPTAPR